MSVFGYEIDYENPEGILESYGNVTYYIQRRVVVQWYNVHIVTMVHGHIVVMAAWRPFPFLEVTCCDAVKVP